MTKFIPFYYDEKGFYQNDKSFMITGVYCHRKVNSFATEK